MNPGIETVVDYLSSVPAWYLATCEGDQPHVRPFSFAAGFDGHIWFCTGKQKDVFRELNDNPRFEASAWKPGHGWLVLRGEADFDHEPNDLIRRAGFAHMRSLGEVYDGVEDANLVFFSVKEPRAWIRDIDGSETELNFTEVPATWTASRNEEAEAATKAEAASDGIPSNEIPPDESSRVEGIAAPPEGDPVIECGAPIDETLVIEQPHDDFMQEPQAFYAEPPQEIDREA